MSEIRRTETMTQAFCLQVAVLSVPFVVAYLAAGRPRAGGFVLGLTAAAALGVWLARRGRVTVARHVVFAASNFSIFLFAAYLGLEAGVQTAYFSMVGHAVMLFRLQEWRHSLLVVLEIACFSVLVYAGTPSLLGLPPMPPAFVAAMAPVIHFLTLALLLVTLLLFARMNLLAERQAEDARRRLSKEIRLVQLLQDVAIVANNATGLGQAMVAAQARIAEFSGWRPAQGGEAEDIVSLKARALGRTVAEGGVVGVPVGEGHRITAVMVFHASGPGGEPLTEPLLATLDNIGKQLASVEERRRAQDESDASRVKMIAASKMATLGEMAGGIAHEINNPLAVIQGYLARIRRHASEGGRAQTEEAIDAINATILRITKIVGGLRAFARDSATDPLEEVPVARIVADTLALSAERFKSKGIQLDVPPVDPALTLPCRPTEISQVLVNLLNNAYDAVLDQPVRRVTLRVEREPGSVQLVVEDTGHGVPEALRDKILQPFFTTKPVGRGTGLGLSISKGIVESHGGTLECQSEAGLTTFRVRLAAAPEGGPRPCQ